MAEVESAVVLRPSPSLYPELYQEIMYFYHKINPVGHLLDLLCRFQNVMNNTDASIFVEHVAELLDIEDRLQATYAQFHKRMSGYVLYPDIVQPLSVALQQIRFGLRMCAWTWQGYCVHTSQFPTVQAPKSCIQRVLTSLIQVPSFGRALHNDVDMLRGAAELVVTTPGPPADRVDLVIPLAEIALCRLHDAVLRRRELTEKDAILLDQIFYGFVESWDERNEQRRETAEKAAAMFKYKDQVHNAESEAERLEKEFHAMFPSYAALYEDFMVDEFGFNVNTSSSTTSYVANPSSLAGTIGEGHVTDETLGRVCAIHQAIFSGALQHTGCSGAAVVLARDAPSHVTFFVKMPRSHLPVPGAYLVRMNQAYGTAVAIIKQNSTQYLPRRFEANVVDAHVCRVRMLLASVAKPSSAGKDHVVEPIAVPKVASKAVPTATPIPPATDNPSTVGQKYNFHTDPNIAELQRGGELLRSMKYRMEELLVEWPDHPILTPMVSICNRLLNFPATSPLSQILYGIDMLLNRAHDWQSSASKRVSLLDYLDPIVELMVHWRKIELKQWPILLDVTAEKVKQKAQTFWCYLYRLYCHLLLY